MSSYLDSARLRATRSGVGLARPRLTFTPRATTTAPRLPFVVLVVSVLAAGLVGLLLLNTALQRGAYEATALRDQAADLTQRQQDLEMEVLSLQEPQRLLEQAARLGMVPNDSPVFISLDAQTLVGDPVAAQADARVDVDAGVPASGARGNKVPVVAAGTGATLSSDVVTVAKPRRDRVHHTGHAGDGDTDPRGGRR